MRHHTDWRPVEKTTEIPDKEIDILTTVADLNKIAHDMIKNVPF